MPTCSRCGEPIEFRYVNGRLTPLHLNGGGWTCSGYGGLAGTDFSGYRIDKESCCFFTNCPECQAPVYFIRHNGGSVWIDPPLGWPWYKHSCMDKLSPNSRRTRTAIVSSFSLPEGTKSDGLVIGIVREAETTEFKHFTLINVETGKDRSIILLLKNNAGFLVGRLVVYDKLARKVFLLESQTYSYRVIARLRPKPSKFQVECPACGDPVSGPALSDHLKEKHRFPGRSFGSTRRK